MAINAYMMISGATGYSTSKQDAIDILSFSFGASQQNLIGSGSSGQAPGGANVQNVSITKLMDGTSPQIFGHCVGGTIFASVEIVYEKQMGDDMEEFMKILMDDAMIASIQFSGSIENPTESVSFAFAKIKVSYNPEVGGSLQGFIDRGWDITALTSW